MSEETIIRLSIVVAGLLLMGLIFWFGRPSPKSQGQRNRPSGRRDSQHDDASSAGNASVDSSQVADVDSDVDDPTVSGLDSGSDVGTSGGDTDVDSIGIRKIDRIDKVVKLYVAARTGSLFNGTDVVVAAEKIGTVYGHGKTFHRLVERKPHLDPIYTVVNVKNQGSLDLDAIDSVQTPAIAFYLMLPAPIPALDAFEMMFPAANRAAGLLNGILLDEQQNVVSRQTVAHIREELRQYDREHEIQSAAESKATQGSASRWS